MVRISRGIHSATLIGRDHDVARRAKHLTRTLQEPISQLQGVHGRDFRRAFSSHGDVHGRKIPFPVPRKYVDDPSQSAATVEAGGPATQNFHCANRLAGNASPIDPSTKRIIEWNAVVQDQGATGAAGADAAERYSL